MKQVILMGIILLIFGFAFAYSAMAQSTFNTETLKNAIENYVSNQNPNATKIEIKQTLNPQKFSQRGVVANISHSGNLTENCKVDLIFSYNNQTLTKLPVKINVVSQTTTNDFTQVKINKGDKIKMLHYSGAICIRANGIAMESGSTGDVIKIKKDNNQTLHGFIAEDGNIIIENKSNLVKN